MTERPGTKRESSRQRLASGRRAPVEPLRCSKDGSKLVYPVVCLACGTLHKEPPGTDHFALFALERRYDLDEGALEKAYLELSRALHPDRHKGSVRSVALSASMNAAYATLRNPIKRAEYLLRLLGGKTAEQDKRTPEGFLQEQLELREEVEDARAANARPKLTKRLSELEASGRERLARVGELFTQAQPALDEIRLELNALKYVTNLEDEVRSALGDRA